MTQAIIRPKHLYSLIGLSRTSVWRLGKDPNSGFPKRIRLSPGAVGYLRSEVEAWLASRQKIVED